MTLFCRQIRSREPKNVQKAKQQVYRLTIKYKYNHVTFRRRKKDHDGGRVYTGEQDPSVKWVLSKTFSSFHFRT